MNSRSLGFASCQISVLNPPLLNELEDVAEHRGHSRADLASDGRERGTGRELGLG